MQSLAVVLAVKNRKAVILASGGIYEEVPNQDYFVGQKIVWKQKQHDTMSLLRRGLMIAACLVLLLSSSGYAAAKYLSWTIVSVALGETTVQYRLNAWNEVLSVQTETEDGQALLETIDAASYEPIRAVMERTLTAFHQDNEEATISVEIASRIGKEQQAEEAVTEAREAVDIPVTMERIPWNEMNQPREPVLHMPPVCDPAPTQPELPLQPEVQETTRNEKTAPEMVQDEPFLPIPNADQPLHEAEQETDQQPENLPPVPSQAEQGEPFLPAVGAEQTKADKPAVQPIELSDQEQKDKADTLFFNAPVISEEHLMTAPDHESVSNLGVNASADHQPTADPFQHQTYEEQQTDTRMSFQPTKMQESMGQKQSLPVQDGAGNAPPNMPPSFSDQPNEQRGIPVNP